MSTAQEASPSQAGLTGTRGWAHSPSSGWASLGAGGAPSSLPDGAPGAAPGPVTGGQRTQRAATLVFDQNEPLTFRRWEIPGEIGERSLEQGDGQVSVTREALGHSVRSQSSSLLAALQLACCPHEPLGPRKRVRNEKPRF